MLSSHEQHRRLQRKPTRLPRGIMADKQHAGARPAQAQRFSMRSHLSRHTVTLVAVGLCLVVSVATRAQQPRSLYDRYTEPIQIFKAGLGTFTKPMSSTNTEAQAFFDQGFQMMYSFA